MFVTMRHRVPMAADTEWVAQNNLKLWTMVCVRRSDLPHWPGSLPVPSDVPNATFVNSKYRIE